MNKKLIVPERFVAQKTINPIPPAISKAFDDKEDANPNSKDPSKLQGSVLDRFATANWI